MSALKQQSNVFESLRLLEESDATREISRQANTAIRAASGLNAIAHSTLLVPGVVKVNLEVSSGLLEQRTFEWRGRSVIGPVGTVISRIATGARIMGNLRIEFEISDLEVESPVRFAQFLGQQIAGMLERMELRQLHENLRRQVLEHRQLLASRKLIHRAAGILAASLNLSESAALAELYERARVANEPPTAVAEAIIAGEQSQPRYLDRAVRRGSSRLTGSTF